MKRITALIFFFLISFTLCAKEDSLFIKVIGDTVQIWNTDVAANCASQFTYSMLIQDSNLIVITEIDTIGTIANCICSFDLHFSLTGLSAGQYTFSINRQELEKYFYHRDTTIFVGELTFTLENSLPVSQSSHLDQSECNPLSEQTFTAQHWYAEADSACQEIRTGAKVINIWSADVAFDGKSAMWNYKFLWYDQLTPQREYLYFHNNQNQVIFDSISLYILDGPSIITEDWFDSDFAVAYAEESGGQLFREGNPDYFIKASLSQALVPYSYPCWSITYQSKIDENKKLSLHFDARKNSSTQLSFFPSVDTLFLLSGCTPAEFSFRLGDIGAAEKISLEPGFNTSAVIKDSIGNYIPAGESYFLVTHSDGNYEYELWYHPKSDPPFEPLLIPFDSVFYSNQRTFEIELVIKVNGVPVGSIKQFFVAESGLNAGFDESIPEKFELFQNYPNPFNPSTVIKFSLAAPVKVQLKIYDLLGNEVALLVNEEKPAGGYKIEFDFSSLSSGIYFYKLQSGNYSAVKKMLLLK